MLTITPIKDYDNSKYSVVRCQICKQRLCDKPLGLKARIYLLEGPQTDILEHVVLICKRCKRRYIVTIE